MVGGSRNEPRLSVFFAALNKISQKVLMLHKRVDKNPSERTLGTLSDELISMLLRAHEPVLQLPRLRLTL
jgi:hypothetical protein